MLVDDQSRNGPHPDLRPLIAQHARELARWLPPGSVQWDNIEILSQRTYEGRSRYTSDDGTPRNFSTCIARAANQPVPTWPEHTDHRTTPHVSDAPMVTGDLLFWAGAGQNKAGGWILASLTVNGYLGSTPALVHPVGMNTSIIAGVGFGCLVLDDKIERLRIELSDGVIYEDTVHDGVLHVHAWLDSEVAQRGEIKVQIIDNTGRVVQEERIVMPESAI